MGASKTMRIQGKSLKETARGDMRRIPFTVHHLEVIDSANSRFELEVLIEREMDTVKELFENNRKRTAISYRNSFALYKELALLVNLLRVRYTICVDDVLRFRERREEKRKDGLLKEKKDYGDKPYYSKENRDKSKEKYKNKPKMKDIHFKPAWDDRDV